MLFDELVATLNAGCVCPPEAGPAWRKAVTEGVDMSLVERSLGRSPWQRLLDHDQALALMELLRENGTRLHE
jgi:hypothetical protein